MENKVISIGKCENCGNTLIRKRVSKTTCSDACRTALSRSKRAKLVRVDEIHDTVQSLLHELSEFVYDDTHSLNAAYSLNSIQSMAAFYKINNDGSWWRCKKCKVAVRRSFPSEISCSCTKPQWVLQKTLI